MPFLKSRKSKFIPGPAVPIIAGNLRLHELHSRIFRNTRFVRVWLPPDFDGSGAIRYPVLYLNDGQNLFEATTAFGGVHWQAGETAERLIRDGEIPPLILVGIDNTGTRRMREYIPYRSLDPRILAPLGKRYPEFLLREVIPLVGTNYPVATSPELVGLGGSSLGGLIALYTQFAAPGIFGKLLIESPSLFVAKRKVLAESRRFHDWPFRIYLGIGSRESGDAQKDVRYLSDFRELETILRQAGLNEHRLRANIEDGANHSEASWARRFPEALRFLFGDLTNGSSSA